MMSTFLYESITQECPEKDKKKIKVKERRLWSESRRGESIKPETEQSWKKTRSSTFLSLCLRDVCKLIQA